MGNFGPQSELSVCPLPSVGDDISFIMQGNHVALQYTGKKSDYDLPLTEHPLLSYSSSVVSI